MHGTTFWLCPALTGYQLLVFSGQPMPDTCSSNTASVLTHGESAYYLLPQAVLSYDHQELRPVVRDKLECSSLSLSFITLMEETIDFMWNDIGDEERVRQEMAPYKPFWEFKPLEEELRWQFAWDMIADEVDARWQREMEIQRLSGNRLPVSKAGDFILRRAIRDDFLNGCTHTPCLPFAKLIQDFSSIVNSFPVDAAIAAASVDDVEILSGITSARPTLSFANFSSLWLAQHLRPTSSRNLRKK